ncbi:MAG: MFS transporter [Pseudomonadota bacterium]
MRIANFSLLFVVFLDVMGQGLVIPIVTTLVLSQGQALLDAETSTATRQLYYGLTIGGFFLSWFLGAAYISKLTDVIGRKRGILICLGGNLTGYVLSILAIYLSSFPLLILGRLISGFTAGNQPIAQAALVDLSGDDQEKTRNMGYVVVALSLGLVAGPLMSGVLSDSSLLGSIASIQLPFYAASVMVLVNIALIVMFFHNVDFVPKKLRIRVTDIFRTLWDAGKRPIVLKLSLVFFCSQFAVNSFFIFVDSYLLRRFDFDTFENSIILVVFGGAMALAGAFLVPTLTKRFSKKSIIYVALAGMAVSQILFMLNPIAVLAYVLVIPFVVGYAANYPQMLTLFSSSVDKTEQGWVMGVTVALWTLGAGIISSIGGELMSISIHLPFAISAGSLVIATVLMVTLWRGPDFEALTSQSPPEPKSNA